MEVSPAESILTEAYTCCFTVYFFAALSQSPHKQTRFHPFALSIWIIRAQHTKLVNSKRLHVTPHSSPVLLTKILHRQLRTKTRLAKRCHLPQAALCRLSVAATFLTLGLQMSIVRMIVRQEATQLTFLDKDPGVTDDRSSSIDPLQLAVLMQTDICRMQFVPGGRLAKSPALQGGSLKCCSMQYCLP
jgi:hypothetical protein